MSAKAIPSNCFTVDVSMQWPANGHPTFTVEATKRISEHDSYTTKRSGRNLCGVIQSVLNDMEGHSV